MFYWVAFRALATLVVSASPSAPLTFRLCSSCSEMAFGVSDSSIPTWQWVGCSISKVVHSNCLFFFSSVIVCRSTWEVVVQQRWCVCVCVCVCVCNAEEWERGAEGTFDCCTGCLFLTPLIDVNLGSQNKSAVLVMFKIECLILLASGRTPALVIGGRMTAAGGAGLLSECPYP